MIDRDKDNILGEYINLHKRSTPDRKQEKRATLTFFVHFASRPFSYPSFSNFDQKKVLK